MAREDIRLDTGFLGNLKAKRLLRELGDHGVVCMVRLWCYVAGRFPKGILVGYTAEDLEEAAGWTGERGAFAAYAIRKRWVDQAQDGTLAVHDWREHQPYIFHSDKRSEAARIAATVKWERYTKRGGSARRKRGVSDPQCAPDAGRYAPAPAPNPSPSPSPAPSPEEKKSVDLSSSVSEATAAKPADGALPLAAPPPAATGGNGTKDVHPKIKALRLPAEKEAAIVTLYQRHQAERIRGDDLSERLRAAGLNHLEIVQVAPLFLG